MASRISPLHVEAPPAAAVLPPPAQPDDAFPRSFLWLLVPVFMFLLYATTAHFVLNHGGIRVTGTIENKVITVTTNYTTVSLGGSINMSLSFRKTGRVHPVPDLVIFNLTLAGLKGHLVSTFSSASYNMSVSKMKVKFEPHQTHLPEELVLLVEQHLKQKNMWVSLSADFKWHLKERKVELEYGGYKHARFACYFPALTENYKGICR
ncbi:hypothetical protein E3N88_19662 [Mikania micrantha]|uniref:Late embryogenesis abundant protein LEA-2 subgroup domain-containing protein n=1 Tax=Mikania micrantha TaxID=192012 RepID=A0A5N6NNX7_9ASTR|nr:hypothetical protein E3N88_19662 [Mikania micrantha]